MKRETKDRKYRKALAQTYDPRVSPEQYYNKHNIFKGKTVTAQCRSGRYNTWKAYYAPMTLRLKLGRRSLVTDKEVQEVLRFASKENHYNPECPNRYKALSDFEDVEYQANLLFEEFLNWEAKEQAYYAQIEEYWYENC